MYWPTIYTHTIQIYKGPTWNAWLDYPGDHIVHLHTGCGWSQRRQEEDIWYSTLNLVMVKEPELEAYWGKWNGERSAYWKWIPLMATTLPILREREYCYGSEREAEAGHQKLAYYLEQFMVARRLFDDIVEEMQAKRRALLEEVGFLHLAQHL